MDVLALFGNPGFQNLGATALLGLCVVMILTGRLVPRSVAEMWRKAYLAEKDSGAVKDKNNTQLVESVRVIARALDAIPGPNGGEPDVSDTEETRRTR